MKLEEIRKGIEEKKQGKKEIDSLDMDEVERIVKKMKKKYAKQGMEEGETSDKLSELRGIIAEQERAKIELQTVDELKEYKNPAISFLAKFYSIFKIFMNPVSGALGKLPIASQIEFYLYSANMKYSLKQYLALTVALTAISTIFGIALFLLIFNIIGLPLLYSVLGGLLFFLFSLTVMLLIPKSRAVKRGDDISTELPFALRHMSTELKSGIGLFKTLQAIASSDYGLLSEEFARTINEIEEGTDTRDSLKHLAMRTQSLALRNALLHINRALKTGGNLSKVMNEIAEDVSFELRMKVRDFSEKINFFGVIFIIGGIVLPVMIAILGGILNAPLGIKMADLSPTMILIIYIGIMPMVLGILVFYLRMIQPKV
ncbi:MAG: type II secretion system F family protein [Candidatus Diapherotrites archaeon]|nr:type II secretion system F family protein [Candidatus Diapherotrites archaeon]